MTQAPTTPQLAEAAGISLSYASEILCNRKVPPLSLAAHIWRKTGWRHARLASYNEEHLASIADAEPWTGSRSAKAA